MRYEDLQEKVIERIDLHRELDDDDLSFIAAAGHTEMPKDKDKRQ